MALTSCRMRWKFSFTILLTRRRAYKKCRCLPAAFSRSLIYRGTVSHFTSETALYSFCCYFLNLLSLISGELVEPRITSFSEEDSKLRSVLGESASEPPPTLRGLSSSLNSLRALNGPSCVALASEIAVPKYKFLSASYLCFNTSSSLFADRRG